MADREGTFAGYDGTALFEQSWLPEGPPRGAVVIVHGLIEHSGRFAGRAELLRRAGFAVHAMDLRGHGRSAGPRCDVQSFDDYLRDLDVFYGRVKGTLPHGPVFLMANSMGGLIGTQWTIRRQADLAGLIVSGPLFAVADEMFPRLRALARPVARLLPWLRIPRVRLALLSRSPEAIESYRCDPLFFRGRFTLRMGAEILKALARLPDEVPALRVPLLILHGGCDRVCDPAGSRMVYQRAASADKTLRLYDGLYHEVFDEPEREQVEADFMAWLQHRAAR